MGHPNINVQNGQEILILALIKAKSSSRNLEKLLTNFKADLGPVEANFRSSLFFVGHNLTISLNQFHSKC